MDASEQRFDSALDALDRARALATDYLASLPTRPVSYAPSIEEMAAALDEPLPDTGCDPAEAVSEWFRRAERGIVASSGPRFFGYVNGGTTPAALAGDWLASAIDQNAGMWPSSPAAAQTEQVVVRWLKELFHLPAEWVGTLTSGATTSNLVGLAAARQWAGLRLGYDAAQDGLAAGPAIPIISSTEIHASAAKALATLGLGRANVRRLPALGGSMELAALEAALAETHGPVIVIANAGEVNTGAFDHLAGIAALCRAHVPGAWLHVDAAFGLFAAASPRLRPLVAGIELADSVAADGHKWLNVPYDSGFAFVRDAELLRAAFAVSGAYIAPAPGAGLDPFVYVPEMSRRFRALPAWCALRAYGRDGYRQLVERCVDNAQQFAAWVEETPELELLAPANLIIVCFRYAPEGLDDAATDALNRRAVAEIQADGRAFVTGTVWDGRAAIRAAFDNWSTMPEDVDILAQAVAHIGARLSHR